MILQTARLTLRRARMDDLAALAAILSRPEAMRYWSTPAHADLEESRVWLARMVAGGVRSDDFVIEHGGAVIGKAGAWAVPEVGFLLHPDQWRQGFAAEAMRAVIPYLFATHDVPILTADVDPRNTASRALLERLGFRVTGEAARTILWGDEWCDSVYYGLTRGDWLSSAGPARP